MVNQVTFVQLNTGDRLPGGQIWKLITLIRDLRKFAHPTSTAREVQAGIPARTTRFSPFTRNMLYEKFYN